MSSKVNEFGKKLALYRYFFRPDLSSRYYDGYVEGIETGDLRILKLEQLVDLLKEFLAFLQNDEVVIYTSLKSEMMELLKTEIKTLEELLSADQNQDENIFYSTINDALEKIFSCRLITIDPDDVCNGYILTLFEKLQIWVFDTVGDIQFDLKLNSKENFTFLRDYFYDEDFKIIMLYSADSGSLPDDTFDRRADAVFIAHKKLMEYDFTTMNMKEFSQKIYAESGSEEEEEEDYYEQEFLDYLQEEFERIRVFIIALLSELLLVKF